MTTRSDTARFKDIAQVKRANKAIGHFWFSKDTMKFFASRIESRLIDGHYFITSEQPPHGGRRFSARYARPSGAIETVGDFMGYRTIEEARLVALSAPLPQWDVDEERRLYAKRRETERFA